MTEAVAAVVLAAGAGSRFGGDKLAALWDVRPLLAHVLAALKGGAGVVVCRPGDDVTAALARAHGLSLAVNPHPELGLSESLRSGLAALDPAAVEWALIVLGDQPLLRGEVVDALLVAADDAHDLVRPVYAEEPGRPGHPVLVHRRIWELAASLGGDQGLGSVVPRERILLVPVPGSNPDVDTADDLERLSVSRLTPHDSRPDA